MKAPLPADETARLGALRALGILDSDPESVFDELVALAAGLCGTPISLISLVDETRQWFKARVGLAATETSRDVAFCAHVILQDGLFEIPDAAQDERFATNPLVTHDPKIRFYAGVPLKAAEGYNLGTLCVLDHVPRKLTAVQRGILETLGRAVTAQLDLRRALALSARLNEERTRAEAELVETTKVLSELTSIAFTALADLEIEKAFDRVLSLLLSFTGSELGFIAESQRQKGGDPELRILAFGGSGWAGPPGKNDSSVRALSSLVTGSGEAVICNDPPNDPRFVNFPTESGPLRSFLGIPLRSGDELSGVIGVANAPEGYETSAPERLQPIVAMCTSFIGNVRLERHRRTTEDALRLSEERYRLLVDSSLDAIIGVDEAGAITSWNPQAELVFKWPADEAIGRLLVEMIIPEEDRGSFPSAGGAALLATAESHSLARRAEVTAVRRNGNRFPVEIAVSEFPSQAGTAYSIFIRDITERAESERAVTRSEKRLRQTLTSARAGAWEWDFVTEQGFWSEEDFELLGYEPGSVEPSLEALLAHVHPDDRAGALAAIEGAVASRSRFEYDYRIIKPDGTFRWVRDVGDVECDDDGRPLRVSGIVTDITDRKNAALDLAETTSRLTALIQSLDAGLLVEDELRKIRLANRELCRQFGLPGDPDSLLGADCAAAASGIASLFEDPERFLREIDETIAARVPVSATEVRLVDGRIFERDYVPIRIGEESIGQLWQYRDVTSRKTAEKKLLEQSNQLSAVNAQLERAGRLKDEFLAAMSHELRTPLNAVLGLAEALHAGVFGALNDEQAQQVAVIEDSGRHLLELINDILDLSKIGAGMLELSLAPVDPAAICNASLRMVREAALRKRIRLSSSYDPKLALVMADSLRLRQILVNLLSNAVKFTHENGSVSIETRCDLETGRACFVVADDGIGIDSKDLPRLFKPFIQLDSRLAREHAGTGLGLSLVQQLAELHGGGVSLETAPGKGSRFTVALPWDPVELEAIVDNPGNLAAATPAKSIQRRNSQPGETEPPLLLVIDDHTPNARTLGAYLTAVGYRVAVAHSGMQGIERATIEKPALILMDIQMPALDGLETTARIRAIPDIAATPIIALTALAMPNDRERSLAAGVDDYVTRPVKLATLATLVEKYLQKER